MAEREGGEGIEDSSWVVGPDGFTFHEHVGLEEAWAEEMAKGEALTRFLRSLSGPSLEDMFKELANVDPNAGLRPEGHALDF